MNDSFREAFAGVTLYDAQGNKIDPTTFEMDPDWLTMFLNPDHEFEVVEETVGIATGPELEDEGEDPPDRPNAVPEQS